MTRLGFIGGVIGAVVLAAAARAAQVGAAEAAKAREILDAAGVKGGLVVHIGCQEGKLTAALRASESYLVHGLDTDAAKVASALSGTGWPGSRAPMSDFDISAESRPRSPSSARTPRRSTWGTPGGRS